MATQVILFLVCSDDVREMIEVICTCKNFKAGVDPLDRELLRRDESVDPDAVLLFRRGFSSSACSIGLLSATLRFAPVDK